MMSLRTRLHVTPMHGPLPHVSPLHVTSAHRRMNRHHVTPMHGTCLPHLLLPHVRSVMKMLTLQIIQIMAVFNTVREPEKKLIAKKNRRKKHRKKGKKST